jgi:hypothetical protein
MDENTDQRSPEDRDITAPPAPTHDAAAPPANPPTDEEAVRKGEDTLEQAGGGH